MRLHQVNEKQQATASGLTSDVEVLCLQLRPHVEEGEHGLVQVSLGLCVVGVVVIFIVREGQPSAHRVVNEQHVGCSVVCVGVLGQIDPCDWARGVARLSKLEVEVERADLQQVGSNQKDNLKAFQRKTLRSGEEE